MVSFNGFHESMVTFNAEIGVNIGTPVIVSENATVSAGIDGAVFCGIARSVRENIASVQMSGYMKLPYSGTAPSLGVGSLVCDGNNGVKTGNGKTVVVVEVDSTNMTVGFIL